MVPTTPLALPLEPYDRTTHAVLLKFEWVWQGELEVEQGPAQAWFAHWERANTNRSCHHCGAKIDSYDPCWVSGNTGFVLCEECPSKDTVELLQEGDFREAFTPTEHGQRGSGESATLGATPGQETVGSQ